MKTNVTLSVMALLGFGAAVLVTAPLPQYVTTLHFADGSVEICPTFGYVIDNVTLNVSVATCVTDTIFDNGFEPAHARPERER